MTHTEIVNKVKSILNEHGEVDAVSIGKDRVLLEDYIESAIPDAVIMLAQKGYAVNVYEFNMAVDSGQDRVILSGDTDFISLISLQLKGWKVATKTVHSIDSPAYIMAMNPYTGPTASKPFCWDNGYSIMAMPPGEIELGLYNGVYDGANLYPREEKEATAVCYMTAALVLGMFGDDQGKQRLSDISTNLLN